MEDHNSRTNWVPRILRGAVFAGLTLTGLAIAGAIVLWDADIYTARDKFEHFKMAIFGDWKSENWCPPGRVSDNCEMVNDFTAALEKASDFTFFKTVPIDGTPLSIVTGIRFATAHDVVDGQPASEWCYLTIPNGSISQRIQLATKTAVDPPNYTDLASLDASPLSGVDLEISQLALLARSHCRFGVNEDA